MIVECAHVRTNALKQLPWFGYLDDWDHRKTSMVVDTVSRQQYWFAIQLGEVEFSQ